MSQPAVAALAPLPFDFEIVVDDEEPLESPWHYEQMHLLYDLLHQVTVERGRTDVYVGANQFVYYSVEHARDVARLFEQGRKPKFRGPDVFWVAGVDPLPKRECWKAWEEGGRLPDVIFELMSKSNRPAYRKEKKELYARIFRTAEYFTYSPRTRTLEGFRLAGGEYRPIAPADQGWFWSEQLQRFVGCWHGTPHQQPDDWVRLFRPNGSMVPLPEEKAQAAEHRAEAEHQRAEEERRRAEAERRQSAAERQRAEAERQRAEAAEAELARLRALLDERARG